MMRMALSVSAFVGMEMEALLSRESVIHPFESLKDRRGSLAFKLVNELIDYSCDLVATLLLKKRTRGKGK
jgi:hypothetical protein